MSCQQGYHKTANALAPTLGAVNSGAGTSAARKTIAGMPSKPSPMFNTLSRQGRITAVSLDDKGYTRCSNCGQFASRTKAHMCPMTTNATQLGKSLKRRLQVPPTAYGEDALTMLLSQARIDGSIDMRHGLTKERTMVTLDGLSVALASGYVPNAWLTATDCLNPTMAYPTMAVTPNGKVVAVLDTSAKGLRALQYDELGAMANAAAAYGAVLPPNTTVEKVITRPSTTDDRPPMLPVGAPKTSVEGGLAYDMGHFAGTEYRKGGHQGTMLDTYGYMYEGGNRSNDRQDWATARLDGLAPPPKGGVAVGRTLVSAVDILGRGSIVETQDGVMEVYDQEGALLSAYDPKTNTAGDIAGNPNASPQQMAAFMSYHLAHPKTALDKAFVGDFASMLSDKGTKTPLAVADAAYLVMQHDMLSGGKTINLGGQVQTRQCPQCGQFIGNAPHTCPTSTTTDDTSINDILAEVTMGTARTLDEGRVIADAMASGIGVPVAGAPTYLMPQDVSVVVETVAAEMDAGALGERIAAGLRNVETKVDVNADVKAVAQLDPDQMGKAISAGLADYLTLQQDQQSAGMQALAGAITSASAESNKQLVEAIGNIIGAKIATQADGAAGLQAVQGGTPEWADALVDALNRMQPATAGAMQTKRTTTPHKEEAPVVFERMANEVPDNIDAMTAQEFIMSPITLPEPDPLLSNVPARVGGQLRSAIPENIPAVDPNYYINEDVELAVRTVSAMIQQGAHMADDPRSGWTKAFMFYGPAGTGKNKTAEQIAATVRTIDKNGKLKQGIGYYETTFTAETNMDSLIGSPLLEPDPETGATRSRLNIGPLAAAAASGSVIALNEIVNCDPKKVAVLQDMIEKRKITLESPEGGQPVVIPVHPSTIFVGTMNAGYEGGRDRPGLAMLSRMTPIKMDRPSKKEMAERIEGFFASMEGDTHGVEAVTERRQQILQNDYSVPRLVPQKRPKMIEAAAELNEQIAMLARRSSGVGGEIGQMSDTPPEVGPREAVRFAALANAIGPWRASRIYDIYCDQSTDMFQEQRALIDERVESIFGPRDLEVDAVTQVERGDAPAQS